MEYGGSGAAVPGTVQQNPNLTGGELHVTVPGMKRREFIKASSGSALCRLAPKPPAGRLPYLGAQLAPPIGGERTSLAKLQFKNSGTVRREMQFQYFDQPLAYAEDFQHWNTIGKAQYLYQVEAGRKSAPPTGMRSSVPLGGLGCGTWNCGPMVACAIGNSLITRPPPDQKSRSMMPFLGFGRSGLANLPRL